MGTAEDAMHTETEEKVREYKQVEIRKEIYVMLFNCIVKVNVLLEISFIDYILGLNFMMVSFQYAATISYLIYPILLWLN